MSYATTADVARYNLARGTYTATSKPNATQVGQFIEEIAGEIDITLRTGGYITPVSPSYTEDFQFLRGINAVGAAWKVEVAAETSDNEGMYKSMYQSALKMLTSIDLTAPKDANIAMPRSGFGGPGLGPIVGIPSHTTFIDF